MADPTTPRTRMTREYLRISASSGSPLVPPRASPCVTSPLSTPEARIQRRLLGPARPRAHAAVESAIRGSLRPQRGQASVELLGALPALLVVGLVVLQLLAIGYAKVLAGDAAEAGALALAGGADAARAARDAVPGWSKAGMRVRVARREVRVTMRPPSPLRSLGRGLEVGATARVGRR